MLNVVDLQDLMSTKLCRYYCCHNIKINYTYQKAIDQVMQLNKMNAVQLSFDLPWGLIKLRLWVVIITPIYIIRRIKSYY